ncbi:MAG TPA: SDR family NAD(P)-dependent oxidoreductase [Myxococcota bacterium]|nr:SDR family NAD(P)-dependent oxidoreductase [Myxococcota bacterium]
MTELSGKLAVITGGASGIGRALGARFARAGARIALLDVEEKALAAAVAALREGGAEVSGVVCDVTKLESVQAAEREIVARHGHVHLLFNNAGVGAHEDVPIWELPLSDWRWVFAVNVFGVVHGIKAFVPGMLAHGEPGHVVNTSSGNGGLVVVPTTPSYSASKAAVSMISETLHLQLLMHRAKLQAHVLYPGPHIVASNIFDAKRNRPAEFARETAQVAPPVTLDMLKQFAASQGRAFEATTPEEVAEHAYQGIVRGDYYILPTTPESEARLRDRYDGVLARKNPPLVF